MKPRVNVRLVWVCLYVLVVLILNVYAQSGRNAKPLAPTPPQPTPEGSLPTQPDALSKFVGDPSADEYKLVFATSREGPLRPGGSYRSQRAAAEQAERSQYNNFIHQLNKAGEQGYRFVSGLVDSLIGFFNPLGIVKFDEGQYEYAWFETTSSLFFTKEGFEQKYAEFVMQGYRVVDHFLIRRFCESMLPDDWRSPERCRFKDLFILERPKNVKQVKKFALLSTVPRWGGKPSAELTTAINEQLPAGFLPTHVFSQHEILLEQIERPTRDDDDDERDKPDVKIVRGRQSKLEKQVNELSNQGYRMALTNDGIAVMYRRSDSANPVSYVWLDAAKKGFEKHVGKMQESGAIYRMTFPDESRGYGERKVLIFEQSSASRGEKREYKTIKLEFEYAENLVQGVVHIELTSASRETLKLMSNLVKEGFAVRDLFVSHTVGVLLERSQRMISDPN